MNVLLKIGFWQVRRIPRISAMIFVALIIAEVTKVVAIVYGCRLRSAEDKFWTESNLELNSACASRRTVASCLTAGFQPSKSGRESICETYEERSVFIGGA